MSDFAVFLTIVIMVLIDFMIGIPSPKLHVPHMFKVRSVLACPWGCQKVMLGQDRAVSGDAGGVTISSSISKCIVSLWK